MTAVAGQLKLKLGVVGKGGVGKTTVSGLLARAYADRGRQVVAIDTDSNPNLGLSLGLSLAETEAVPVLPRATVVGSGGATAAADLLAEYGRATPAGPQRWTGFCRRGRARARSSGRCRSGSGCSR